MKTTTKKQTKTRPIKRNRNPIPGNITLTVLAFVALLCFFSALWYIRVFGDTGFDSILYTLFAGVGGTQSNLLVNYLLCAVLPTAGLTAGISFGLFALQRHRRLYVSLCLILCLALIGFAAVHSGLVRYLTNHNQVSGLYETEYVDPNSVSITFPEQKRNLIYIYLESMESTYLSTAQGGAMDTCLIPELYQLAKDNINFSHNEDVGGFVEVSGATWTVGAMVAQTAGVPLITPDTVSDWANGYGKEGVFLPGLTSLNNILAENGYNQAIMVGSDAAFGGRNTYFSTHGVDSIYDIYTARTDGVVASDYWVWWGMEDLHLFEYAKQVLTDMADDDEPFAFTMLTVDTHHVGGYTCELCGDTYDESYENAIACSSRQVAAFVEWIQQQDFYENTTIIITGDHFTMDSGYISRAVGNQYIRHGYNCLINAPLSPTNSTNRAFSALDMFPTTLAAIGCKIEGDQLGFGINLFSDRQTLIEKYGYATLNTELSKRTDYYADHFYE